jgi:hypothetical protein
VKALFNARCTECRRLKPKCAGGYLRVEKSLYERRVLCPDCRKKHPGRFRADAEHKTEVVK